VTAFEGYCTLDSLVKTLEIARQSPKLTVMCAVHCVAVSLNVLDSSVGPPGVTVNLPSF
jgi:hypothetical protein